MHPFASLSASVDSIPDTRYPQMRRVLSRENSVAMDEQIAMNKSKRDMRQQKRGSVRACKRARVLVGS